MRINATPTRRSFIIIVIICKNYVAKAWNRLKFYYRSNLPVLTVVTSGKETSLPCPPGTCQAVHTFKDGTAT